MVPLSAARAQVALRWFVSRSLLRHDGLTKELIYLAVSVANQCDYCINSHGYMARQKGMTEEMYGEFMAVVLAAQKGNKIATGYRVPIDAAFEEK